MIRPVLQSNSFVGQSMAASRSHIVAYTFMDQFFVNLSLGLFIALIDSVGDLLPDSTA